VKYAPPKRVPSHAGKKLTIRPMKESLYIIIPINAREYFPAARKGECCASPGGVEVQLPAATIFFNASARRRVR
jgi:hypothetical protein